MTDIREALVSHLERVGVGYGLHDGLKREVLGAWADAILAEFDVAPREGDRWEYGVLWGDDGYVKNYYERELAEQRAAASFGDKIVRRIAARTFPAGEWEVVPDE